MGGILGVCIWALGAIVEPIPLSLRWTFLACGIIALLASCFFAWRDMYREARPYEEETYQHAKAIFAKLSEEAKGALEQLVIRKGVIPNTGAISLELRGTDFVLQDMGDSNLGVCRLNPEYLKIVARLVKEWRSARRPFPTEH